MSIIIDTSTCEQDVLLRIQKKIDIMETGIDIAIANLKSELSSIKMDLSDRRKKGFDTKIAELHMFNIPSKIQMAEVTKDPKDVQKVMQLLGLVRQEIALSKPKDEYIMMKDEEVPQGDDLRTQIRSIMQDAVLAIDEKRMRDALAFYGKLRGMYKLVSDDLRKEVYADTIEIYRRIANSNK